MWVKDIKIKAEMSAIVSLTDREHVLKRPGMYIGSLENQTMSLMLKDGVEKVIEASPGLFKVFDEVITNANDNGYSEISVSFKEDEVSVTNDISINSPLDHENVLKAFTTLRTGSNFDDTSRVGVAGQNGLGVKLTNLFSETFKITLNKNFEKTIVKCSKQMEDVEVTKSKNASKSNYVMVSFKPIESLNLLNFKDIVESRTIEFSAISGKKVKYEGKIMGDFNTFGKYATRVCETSLKILSNSDWEVYCGLSSTGKFESRAFVNGSRTDRGRHVDYVVDRICEKLLPKNLTINAKVKNNFKNKIYVIINLKNLRNPTYDGQSKERLTNTVAQLGEITIRSSQALKDLFRDVIATTVDETDSKELEKIKTSTATVIKGIDKLVDAKNAGTLKWKDTLLFVTEGDSAASLTIAGVSSLKDKENYGVFPLKGKPLNVSDITKSKIASNEEITKIMKILGLDSSKDSSSRLRYGGIVLMTDADVDGFHIRGLMIAMFKTLWPDLLKNGYVKCMITPVIKATKAKDDMSFFDVPSFNRWFEVNSGKGWTIKYYKGLGTSTSAEGREYFKLKEKYLKTYTVSGKDDEEAIEMSMGKGVGKADKRKDWLKTKMGESGGVDYQSLKDIPLRSFVDDELVLYTKESNERCIPSLVDGLKDSQRKILYTAITSLSMSKSVKVAQFAASTASATSYTHGEQSLCGAIINMAQDYMGSNNINLLYPGGQFGTRNHNGSDSAAPRYIFTRPTEACMRMFPVSDKTVVVRKVQEGQEVEYESFYPVIPLILVNGTRGIGMGYSTEVPSFSPSDLADLCLEYANRRSNASSTDVKESLSVNIRPWYRGFKGSVIKTSEDEWTVSTELLKGRGADTYIIEELPPGVSTFSFKAYVEKLDIRAEWDITDTAVRVTLKNIKDENVINQLKKMLEKKVTLSNMHLWSKDGTLKKYKLDELFFEFAEVRYDKYVERREKLIDILKEKIRFASERARFIKMVIDEEIDVRVDEEALDTVMVEKEFRLSDKHTEMPIRTMTKTRYLKLLEDVQKLEKELDILTKKSASDLWKEDIYHLNEVL